MRYVTHSAICLVALILPSCACDPALRPPSPHTTWRVGDSWKVRTWLLRIDLSDRLAKPEKGPPVDVTFEIRRLISTSEFEIPYPKPDMMRELHEKPTLPAQGYLCFEIEVTGPPRSSGSLERHFLYVRQDTGNLIRIIDIVGKDGDAAKKMAMDFPPEPDGPVIEGMRYGLTSGMFTFPDFTKDPNFSVDKYYGPGQQDKEVVTQTITSHTVKSPDGAGHQEYEVTMTIKRAYGESKTVQKWRQGDPWWYEAKRYENGKLQGSGAILLRPADEPKQPDTTNTKPRTEK